MSPDPRDKMELGVDFKPRPLRLIGKFVLPVHSFGRFASVFHGFASQDNLLVEKNGADRRNQDGSKGRNNHPERPKRAGLLGSEIAYLVVLACGGMGVCYGAFNRAGKARNISQTLGWASVVVLSALLGSYSAILLLTGAV